MKGLFTGVLLALAAVVVGLQIPYWAASVLSTDLEKITDFPQYYDAASRLNAGYGPQLYQPEVENTTKPFTHLAYEYGLMRPLGFLSFHRAFLAFALFNLGILALLYWVLRPEIRGVSPLVFAACIPLTQSIAFGQDALLFALCLAASFRAKSQWLAGVILGLASFRFHNLLGLVVLFAIWRAWKFLAGYVSGAAACFLASVAMVGWREQTIAYVKLVSGMAAAESSTVLCMPNLRGLVAGMGASAHLVPILTVAVLGITAWIGRKQSFGERLLLAIAISVISSYHIYLYDFAALSVPLLVWLARAMRECDKVRAFGLAGLIFAPAAVLCLGATRAHLLALAVVPIWWLGSSAPGFALESYSRTARRINEAISTT